MGTIEQMCAGRMANLVEVAPIRDAFLASGLSAYEVANALGWYEYKKKDRRYPKRVDSCRVLRTLGMRKTYESKSRGGRVRYRTHVTYETAGQIARALNMDPWELGL